ncbi:MAG TPA: hypothetical protein VGM93_02920 [Acidimicrobiales bacterium]|jgi:hypothetical protein
MRPGPAEERAFTEDDLTPLVAKMDGLAAAGRGWINLLPEVEDDSMVPVSGGLFAIFTARGPAIPMATWTPAPADKPGRVTFGVEHGSGPQALARLTESQLGLRPGWFKVSDHPKRGLVVTAPATDANDDVLWWLLAAVHALSTTPLTGDWLGRIYT